MLFPSGNSHTLTDTNEVWFSCDLFAAVKALSLLWTSIPCDVSKRKSSYVFHCMFLLFQGDYGGSLVRPWWWWGRNILVGIFNTGIACGDPVLPDLYTSVSAVCHWIRVNTGLHKQFFNTNGINSIPGNPGNVTDIQSKPPNN